MKKTGFFGNFLVRMFAAALSIVLVLAAAGCGAASSQTQSSENAPAAKIGVLQGPTALSMLKAWDDKTEIGGSKPEYNLIASPQNMISEVVSGSLDFAVLPLNAAVNLFNKGTDYRLIGVSTWGNMYVVSTDSSITSLADLKGKTVAVSQQGATPDVVFRYCLEQAKLEKDVKLDYTLMAHPDLMAALVSGAADIALLPEPFVSNAILNNSDLKVVLDVQQLWAEATGGEPVIAMTAVLVKGSFADSYPQAVADFIAAQTASADYATANPSDNAALAEKHGVTIAKPAIIMGTPRCNIMFKNTADSRAEIDRYLNILLDFSPADIGGELPSESFFYASK